MSNVLDMQDALERLGDDKELYLELLQVFLDESNSMFSAVKEAVASGDPSQVDRAAHTLKGACSNISAVEARDVALRIETAGKNSELDSAGELVTALESALTAVDVEAKQLIAAGV